eukprot:TRINITY_DN4367_c0_g1_i2.p1 TRINITY_DN4367_c0_g1~~TRINITY_DN4367_c0_g1_i2.p1  ORF type:complete len:195 (+),score=21.28 TRINITY_DN4367_c0_g1_i2:42-587(+)
MENRLSLPLAGFGVLSALLGSSCCVIQLFLNLFAVGCAGFAVLDPYSGILNALSAASLSYNFWLNYQYSGRFYNKNLLISVVLAILFAIAPTVVNRVNNPVVKPQTKEIHLKVEGMKCLGCANSVHNILNGLPGVVNNKINFEEKEVTVYTNTDDQSIKEQIKGAMAELGYTTQFSTEDSH